MVEAVRGKQSLRAVARKFGVGVATVAHWVERAKGQRLDRVDFTDHSRAPHKTRRTDTTWEERIVKTRKDLAQGDLGAVGAEAIRQTLVQHQSLPPTPKAGRLRR